MGLELTLCFWGFGARFTVRYEFMNKGEYYVGG